MNEPMTIQKYNLIYIVGYISDDYYFVSLILESPESF